MIFKKVSVAKTATLGTCAREISFGYLCEICKPLQRLNHLECVLVSPHDKCVIKKPVIFEWKFAAWQVLEHVRGDLLTATTWVLRTDERKIVLKTDAIGIGLCREIDRKSRNRSKMNKTPSFLSWKVVSESQMKCGPSTWAFSHLSISSKCSCLMWLSKT